jgi:hypothetical protein
MKSSGNVKRQNLFKLKQNEAAKYVRNPGLSQRCADEIKFFTDLGRVDGKHLSTFGLRSGLELQYPEDKGSTLLRNVGGYLSVYSGLHAGRFESSVKHFFSKYKNISLTF